MTTHNLKTWPEYFQSVLDGTKTFEVRRDDRGYQVGDTLVLQEWSPTTEQIADSLNGKEVNGYKGRECRREVTYILRGPAFGIEDGYVVMGLSNEEVTQHDGDPSEISTYRITLYDGEEHEIRGYDFAGAVRNSGFYREHIDKWEKIGGDD